MHSGLIAVVRGVLLKCVSFGFNTPLFEDFLAYAHVLPESKDGFGVSMYILGGQPPLAKLVNLPRSGMCI